MNDIKNRILNLFKGKNKHFIILIAAGLGIVILIFSGNDSTESEPQTTEFNVTRYELALEQKLSELIEEIDGAGSANVVITLESGSQSVYANSEKQTSSVSQGNGQSNSQHTSESEIIIVDDGSRDQPLLVTELLPKVQGVVVVCPGARDVVVREKIVLAVMTALNISSSNVYVTY